VKIGLRFKDYRLEYQVARELRSMGVDFTVIQGRADDYLILSDFQGDILCGSALECRRKLLPYLMGKESFFKIVVGVDPGPRPGVAVVGDNSVLETRELRDIYEVRRFVDSVSSQYNAENLMVRVGNGDIVNRNRIVNSLLPDYRVEIVDERNTSEGSRNRNEEAAKQIALSRGRVVREKLNVVVSDGYLREIQRKSRIESGGMITISRALAMKVARGDMSMERAIEISRDSNGEGEGD